MKSSITEQTTLTPVGHLTCVGPSVADLGTNVRQISRFAQLSGARLPEPVVRRLEAVGKAAAAVRAVGVEIAVELCQRLLAAGAPGLHFSTLNHSTATRKAFAALGLGALR
jgi:methylenetetrahydrofolate reductase (NADPH)